MDTSFDARARLASVRGFVFDLDGTLVLGDARHQGLRVLPGALELTRHLADRGIPFVVLTNGTVRPPHEYVVKLRDAGLPLSDNSVLTPASVAAEYFVRRRIRRVMALGTEGVRQPLEAAGIEILPPTGRQEADAVFVGWFREFGMEHVEAACHAVENGAKLFVASLVPYFAGAHGKMLSTSRVIAAAVTSVTGRRAHVLGKPSPDALRIASRHLGVDPAHIAVVGDDPALEVLMAKRAGALGIAVSSGVGNAAEFAELPPEQQPDLAVHDVSELFRIYTAAEPVAG